jgi:hypothetical protein
MPMAQQSRFAFRPLWFNSLIEPASAREVGLNVWGPPGKERLWNYTIKI